MAAKSLSLLVVAGIGIAVWAGVASRQDPRPAEQDRDPPAALAPAARNNPDNPVPVNLKGQSNLVIAPGRRPAAEAAEFGRRVKAAMEANVRDYSAVLVKRERNGGEITKQSMFLKIRHQPFSVYAYTLVPKNQRGEEAIYVAGQHREKVRVHTTGVTGRLMGTVSLDPEGSLAMKGQHHPITEIGMLNLCQSLIALGEKEAVPGEVEVCSADSKINDRPCTSITIRRPMQRPGDQFYLERIYVDDAFKLPVRFEGFNRPKAAGGEPELLEEYTYVHVTLNNGFGNADFDTGNPSYGFP